MDDDATARATYRDKLRSIGYLSGGRTRARVAEGRRPDGMRFKATTDELGNTTTEHDTADDRVDVTIRPATVVIKAAEVTDRGT